MDRQFGNYIRHERIGIGGMGEVYRATKLGPDGFKVQVALKVILPDLAREKSFKDRFSREANLAASLQHPNIVNVHGYENIDGVHFIEMEYVPGTDLRRVLRSVSGGEKLSLEESMAVLYAVARGLEHAHGSAGDERGEGGVIHCDLNPHNILISTLGEVKVTDFGIARAVHGDASASATVRGKLAYMSPEQMEGRKLDRRTDLFSFGIIAYQLLSGKHPFERGSEGATIAAIGRAEHLPLSQVEPGLPPALHEMVKRLLSFDPAERPDSMSPVLKIIEPLVVPSAVTLLAGRVRSLAPGSHGEPGALRAGSMTPATRQQTALSRLWPYLAAGIAGIALVAGAFLIPIGVGPERTRVPDSRTPQPQPGPVTRVEAEPSPTQRTVIVQSRPAGAHILADGIPRGSAPVAVESGPDGSMPALEARLYGYMHETFRIPDDADGSFVVTLAPLPEGTVRIHAIPWARVNFRGEDMGDTPLVLEKVPVGKRTFTLTYDPLGVKREIVVDVTAGRNTVSVDMREDR